MLFAIDGIGLATKDANFRRNWFWFLNYIILLANVAKKLPGFSFVEMV